MSWPGGPRAQVLLGRLGVEHQLGEHLPVVGDLVQLIGRELIPEPFHDHVEQAPVDVGAAERRVPVGGQHLDRAARDPQHRGVERAPAQVVDQDGPVAAEVSP